VNYRHSLLCVTLIVVAASVALAQPRQPSPSVDADPALELAVRAVLGRFQDRRHIPDIRLLPATGPIPLVAEARTFRWTDRVLPSDGGRAFQLASRAELQAAADAQGANQYYAFVHDERITPDLATLWVGTAFARPSTRRGPVECCCSSQVQLRRDGASWVPVESDTGITRCH
jgi:hypothetical protein